jgi:hypothetical protein
MVERPDFNRRPLLPAPAHQSPRRHVPFDQQARQQRRTHAFGTASRTISSDDSLSTGVGASALTSPSAARMVQVALGDDAANSTAGTRKAVVLVTRFDGRARVGRYQQDSAVASQAEVERLAALLGRQPRSYREFARNMAAMWAKA